MGGAGKDLCQQFVTGLVNTKWFVGRARSLSPQLLAGVAPTGVRLHHHGWETDGRREHGWEETVARRLAGCTIRSKCLVAEVGSHRDFGALVVATEIPKRIHPEGF